MNTLPNFVDMKAMLNYAKEKGVAISALTYAEKEKFLKANPMNKGIANNLKNTKVIETVHIQTKKAKQPFRYCKRRLFLSG